MEFDTIGTIVDSLKYDTVWQLLRSTHKQKNGDAVQKYNGS